MSTEHDDIFPDGESPEINFTSYYGGIYRGPCVQLTQWNKDDGDYNYVSLTTSQAVALVARLAPWLEDNHTMPKESRSKAS